MYVAKRPQFSVTEAEAIAARHFDIAASATRLPSERDQNFKLVTAGGPGYVLKISHPDEQPEMLDFEDTVLDRLSHSPDAALFPRVVQSIHAQPVTAVADAEGKQHFVRLVTFLPGTILAETNAPDQGVWSDIGSVLGRMHGILAGVRHPAMARFFYWDAAHAPLVIRENLDRLADAGRRELVERFIAGFETRCVPHLPDLRRGVIHNDFNDHNILVAGGRVSGIVDFGDMVHSYTVGDLAIACAYAMLGKDDPIGIASEVVRGYRVSAPLPDVELEVLADFVLLRLCLSVCISAKQQAQEPSNPYLSVSERAAWDLLERFAVNEMAALHRQLASPSTRVDLAKSAPGADELLRSRRRHLGRNLSVSYREPLTIVRGAGQYLYAADGRAYLDCVNNVCHVGHCHLRVVAAGQRQMAVLNTNTRYLHDTILEYARRLTDTLPAPLSVCYFVNSGSEANELALRMARTYTGRRDVLVIDHAYHGNTQGLIDISPYKFNRKGGQGRPESTHITPIPDTYRGPFRADDPAAGTKYAEKAADILAAIAYQGPGIAAFIAESLVSCAGQIVLPDGYLSAVFASVRAAGGVCIADEVQVGFGRVGSHMWGFKTQGVVPDIMTFGKPAGNGHPLAGVVTTAAIAGSFSNGMEYFNTFGGNPVSCAIGLEVLNVLRDECLQAQALEVGDYLFGQLRQLQARHPQIGDVRGRGFFLGVEFVSDPVTREPAAEMASGLVNRLRRRGILLSTDGPFENVIKFKPPLVFNRQNADDLLAALDDGLRSPPF